MRTVEQLQGGPLVVAIPQFRDERGMFSVPYEAEAARDLGISEPFVQDNHSISHHPGTIRGIHLQLPPHEQGKLVRVLRGRILDVVVDLRPDSPTVGACDSIELGAEDGLMIWVPRGFGHGFCTLSPQTEVFYKVDAPYTPDAEVTLAWNDATLGIDWPVARDDVVLSDKDRQGLGLSETLERIAGRRGGSADGPSRNGAP